MYAKANVIVTTKIIEFCKAYKNHILLINIFRFWKKQKKMIVFDNKRNYENLLTFNDHVVHVFK